MKAVPIHEAKARLSSLIQRACEGEDVVISRNRQPVVRLVPVHRAAPKRQFGALRGKVRVDASFFEPLPEEELRAWER
jgi:prevent-host-death family protein